MGPYPRHVRPAPKGPDPIHWWTLRLIGLAIMGVVSALYLGQWLGAFPIPARQFLAGAFFLLGVCRLPAELVHPLAAGGLTPRAVDGARRPAFDREPSEAPGPRAGGGLPDGPGRASREDLGVPRVHVAGRLVAAYQHQTTFDRTVILARSSRAM